MSVILTKSPVHRAYNLIASTEAYPAMSYSEVAGRSPYALPENALAFDRIDHMIHAVKASGSHFFDRDAVRFFNGRTDTRLYGRRFWVESKRYVYDPRTYSVAYVWRGPRIRGVGTPSLSIQRIGEYGSLDKARRAARMLAEAVEAGA